MVIGVLIAALAVAHPMHTSVAELVEEPATHSVMVTIRVFADDFGAVVSGDLGDRAETYVRSHFALWDRAGRAIAVRWDGASRSGDVIQARLRADLPSGLAGIRVRNELLADHFPDQVNIVRATYAGRTVSLLFTPGDEAKALP